MFKLNKYSIQNSQKYKIVFFLNKNILLYFSILIGHEGVFHT